MAPGSVEVQASSRVWAASGVGSSCLRPGLSSLQCPARVTLSAAKGPRPAGTWGPRSPTTPPNSSPARRRKRTEPRATPTRVVRPGRTPDLLRHEAVRVPSSETPIPTDARGSRPARAPTQATTVHDSTPAMQLGRRDPWVRARRPALAGGSFCVVRYRMRLLPRLLPRIAGGGGGIRTHEAFARRFSRPLPSTTRPPLRGAARVARPRCGVGVRDGAATTWRRCARWCGAGDGQAGAMRSVPIAGRSTSGTSTEPSGRWYVSRMPAKTRARARPEPLRVWTSSGFAPGAGR